MKHKIKQNTTIKIIFKLLNCEKKKQFIIIILLLNRKIKIKMYYKNRNVLCYVYER